MKEESKEVTGKDALGREFKIMAVFQIAEAADEAIEGNETAKGLGEKAADKMLISKFLTNQMDDVRTAEATRRNKAIRDGLKAIAPDKLAKASAELGIDLKALLNI